MLTAMNPLFSIGHSNHTQQDFIRLLTSNEIEAVADVRSYPYSRRNPQFSRDNLCASLGPRGIRYVFLGRELGARREDPECYVDGRASYELIAQAELFQRGLERVCDGLTRYRVALLCAEHDPIIWHRMILVCRHLRGAVKTISHILRDGKVEPNENAEQRLVASLGLNTALAKAFAIEQAYGLQAERIAYVEQSGCADHSASRSHADREPTFL